MDISSSYIVFLLCFINSLSQNLAAMAQLEAKKRYAKSPGGSSEQTMEQLLRAEDNSWSTHSSPTFGRGYDSEEHDHHARKSVLTKVKEKAKKLRNTLSKKKHGHDETPPWGVSLEDHDCYDDDEDADAEYYGAPMYESVKAPEDVKEKARQHPREDLVIADKHVLPNSPSPRKGKVREVTSPMKITNPHVPPENITTRKTAPEPVLEKPAQSLTVKTGKSTPIPETVAEKHVRPETIATTKPISECLAEKPGPLETVYSDPTSIKVRPEETAEASKTITETVTEKLAPAYAMASGATGMITSKLHDMALATSAALSPKQPPNDASEKKYDKGVSVREYLRQKLEPGEDEKALSKVITEAISPRKGSTAKEPSKEVIEKVRGAMSSHLATDQSSSPIPRNSSTNYIPISTNVYEVVEEENNGRILQAN